MQLLINFTCSFKNKGKILFKGRKMQPTNNPIPNQGGAKVDKTQKIFHKMNKVHFQEKVNIKSSQDNHKNDNLQSSFQPKTKIPSEQDVQLGIEHPNNQKEILGQDTKEYFKSKQLTRLITKESLPIDLMRIHEENNKQFTHKHYEHLIIKLSYYSNRPENIKKQMIQKRSTNAKKKKDHCPQLLTKEQVTKHEYWETIMRQIFQKLTKTKAISAFNSYLPAIFALQKGFNFIPSDIYNLVLKKNALANSQDLNAGHISSMMQFLKYKNRIRKSTLSSSSIVIDEKEQEQAKIHHFARRLAAQIIGNYRSYTKDDFLNIFIVISRSKKRMNILTQDLLEKSEDIVASYLNQLSFVNVFTYMTIYALFNNNPNRELLERLKMDLSNKCKKEINYHPLLVLIHKIEQRRLILKNYRPVGMIQEVVFLEAGDLAIKVAESLSLKIIDLKLDQLAQFLSSCFKNEISHDSILSSISTQFARRVNDFQLENLGKGLFKLYLLGHQSKLLVKSIFEDYVKRYHKQINHYSEADIFSVPTENGKQSTPTFNFKQINLQQCLMMTIWTLIDQLGEKLEQQIALQDLLPLLPPKLESMDPLVIQITLNINKKLEKFNIFPKIQCPFIPNSFPEGRLKQFYRHSFSKNDIQLLIWQESRLTNKFVENYNYQSQKFLSERWSSIETYKTEDYIKFSISNKYSCFFDENIKLPSLFLQKRFCTISKINAYQNYSSSILSKEKDTKQYYKKKNIDDLLL